MIGNYVTMIAESRQEPRRQKQEHTETKLRITQQGG